MASRSACRTAEAEIAMTESKPRSGLRKTARVLMVLAALLIVAECASFVTLRALAWRDRGRPAPEASLPAYRDVPWAAAYWREHKLFLAQDFEAYPYGSWRSPAFNGETIKVDGN